MGTLRRYTDLPERMADLPVDDRGYPVPWFVAWHDGKPEFRAMDPAKFARAIKEKRCWVCGERLGVNLCFVAGPMCGINRTSSEPPSHLMCARWSAQNCPFLSNPRMVRREDVGEPDSVEWYACGRPATREEVEASIESGLPNREAIAKMERGGLQALTEARARFERWLPQAEKKEEQQ